MPFVLYIFWFVGPNHRGFWGVVTFSLFIENKKLENDICHEDKFTFFLFVNIVLHKIFISEKFYQDMQCFDSNFNCNNVWSCW